MGIKTTKLFVCISWEKDRENDCETYRQLMWLSRDLGFEVSRDESAKPRRGKEVFVMSRWFQSEEEGNKYFLDQFRRECSETPTSPAIDYLKEIPLQYRTFYRKVKFSYSQHSKWKKLSFEADPRVTEEINQSRQSLFTFPTLPSLF